MSNRVFGRKGVGFLFACAAMAVSVGACVPAHTDSTYSHRQLGKPAFVETGTIVAARDVDVAGTRTGIGRVAGAGAGAVAGSTLGSRAHTGILGALGGAVLGGIVGHTVEEIVTRGTATEFVVERDDGSKFAVVQTNENDLQPGDRVLILDYGHRTRLARDYADHGRPYPLQQQGRIAPAER